MKNTQYHIFNDGFAIWFTGNSQSFKFDVHINEWITFKSNYIDIGIRIYNTTNIENGYIFIPFIFLKNDLEDKASALKDKAIACGVFNTTCEIIHPTNKALARIEYNNRIEEIIPLILLDPTLQEIENGTLIQLSFNDVITLLDVPETYIRFRIPHNSLNKHCHLSKSNYKTIIESPIITDKLCYTVKINEARSLPSDISYSLNKYQKINKIIFSLFASTKYEIDDSNCYKIRHLEEHLYKSYIPKGFNCNDAIAYQWLTENKKHYNFFIKIEVKKLSYTSILLYLSLVILLSFLGNILWGLFTLLPFLSWLK